MSRTIKDAPFKVRAMRANSDSISHDWRQTDVYGTYVTDHVWHTMAFKGNRGYTEFRRQCNRTYRARSRQSVREQRYEIDRPRHDAEWLYW